jgi:hypothetical protein
MATPADNLDSLVASLGSIQGIMSTVDSSVQYSIAAINNISAGIATLDMTTKVAANGLYQQLARLNNNVVGAIQASGGSGVANLTTVEMLLTSIDTHAGLLNDISVRLATIDMTIKIAANGLYQQIARLNNNLVGVIRSTGGNNIIANMSISEALLTSIDGNILAILRSTNLNANKKPSNNNQQQNNKKNGKEDFVKGEASFNKALSGITGGIGTAFVSITTELAKFGSQLKAAASKGGFAGFAGVMGLIATAAAGIPAAFMSIVSLGKSFVSALDPALIQQLELAFANLSAVIGIAFTPIISAAVVIFQMMADQLKPVMEFLVPSIQKLALTIIDQAVPYVEMLAYALAEMGPVIDNLTGIMQPLAAAIMPIVIAGFRGIATICNFLIGVVNLLIASFYVWIAAFAKAAAWLVSWVDKKAGERGDKFAAEAAANVDKYMGQAGKSFSDAFGDVSQKVAPAVKGGGSGMAARQASYAGISDLGKSMMQAAFGSSKEAVANQQLEQQRRAADGIDKLIGLGLRQDVGNRRQAGVRG